MTSYSCSKLRVLHLQLEFHRWQDARPWTYSVGLGLEEGLAAAGVQFLTLPSPWLPRAQEILAGQRFDQLWVEVVHQSSFDEGGLEWLASLAPVRVGLIGESLTYTSEDRALWPELWPRLQQRQRLVTRRLAALTHAVVTDERDAETLNLSGRLPAMWWPQAVPKRYIQAAPPPPPDAPALFAGTAYGKRLEFLNHPSLAGLLAKFSSPEDRGIYPSLFEALGLAALTFMQKNLPDWQRSFPEYMDTLRRVRRALFGQFLEGFHAGSAVVNLPHLVKSYAGRVVEGMAAGRPVVSWDLPDRPRNRALYEDGAEILLFDRHQPEHLAEHLRRLRAEPALGQTIAENARRKIRRLHTIERRVAQILDWTTRGVEPVYV
jgi:hypothetical protein